MDLHAAATRYRLAFEEHQRLTARPGCRHLVSQDHNKAERNLLSLALCTVPDDAKSIYEMTRETLTAIRQIARDLAEPRMTLGADPFLNHPPAEPQNLAYFVHSNYRCRACGERMTCAKDYTMDRGMLHQYTHTDVAGMCRGPVEFIGPLDLAAGERR